LPGSSKTSYFLRKKGVANNCKLRIAVLGVRGIPNVQGGVETHCEALYPRLAAKGHDITLFARKGYVPEEPYRYRGVQVVPLWSVRKKSLEAILHTLYGIFYIALRRKSFDLLHIHAIGPSLVIPLARSLGIPVVMTHHGPDYDRKKWGPFGKKVLRFGEVCSAKFATEIIAVSRHIRKLLITNFNRDATYIPNGVDLPDILPPGQFLRKYNLQPRKYFLAVGRLVPEKGFHDLLAAFSGINTDWKLVIAGGADHEDDYSRGIKRDAAKNGQVVMTGFIKGEELQEIFSNAGLFVLPSYHEGLPIVLLEALSYDLPILASDIPANQELVSSEETFPVGDVDALCIKLKEAIQHASTTSQGRARIQSEFNWGIIADKTEEIYRRTISVAGLTNMTT